MNNLKLCLVAAGSALGASRFGSDAMSTGRSVVYENWPTANKHQVHGEGRMVAQCNQQYLLPQIQSSPRGWKRTQ